MGEHHSGRPAARKVITLVIILLLPFIAGYSYYVYTQGQMWYRVLTNLAGIALYAFGAMMGGGLALVLLTYLAVVVTDKIYDFLGMEQKKPDKNRLIDSLDITSTMLMIAVYIYLLYVMLSDISGR